MNNGLYICKINRNDPSNHKYDSYIAHRLLNKITGIDESDIVKNEFGKPYYHNSSLFFNLSHSENYACCYLDDNEVGVDIQFCKENVKFIKIANRFFTENEYNNLMKSDNNLLDFYRMWSAKESYIKLIGKGLSIPLDSFEVLLPDKIGDVFSINDALLKEYLIEDKYICTISSYSGHFPCEINEIEVV